MTTNMIYILIAIIGVLTVAEIVMAVLLISWRMSLHDEAESMHHYTDLVVKLYQETRDYEKQLSERMLIFAEACDKQNERYKDLLKVGEQMCDRYLEIREQHKELLKCWKSIEERYSQTYDQFKLCSDNLKEVSYQITDLANVSTEDEYGLTLREACDTVCLDCPYDQCWKENCPVWHVTHKNNIPDDELDWTEEEHRYIVNTEASEGDDS